MNEGTYVMMAISRLNSTGSNTTLSSLITLIATSTTSLSLLFALALVLPPGKRNVPRYTRDKDIHVDYS